MAEVIKQVEEVFTITLSGKEARLLKAMVQNPMSPDHRSEEEDRLRESIFNGITMQEK